MEQKKLKTSVFSLETILSDSAEQPIDVDFNLPDYCPDVEKILKCRACARISSKGINGRSITVDGCVTITVIYCDADNKLNSYEYQYPFSKNFETDNDCSGASVNARCKCEYINCRAVTARKIDIHGAVGIYVHVVKRRCDDVISDFDDESIELLRGEAPATIPMGSADKYLIIEEEIELGSGQPDICSLIRYDAAPSIKESRLIAGKAVVKGELCLTMLYCSEANTPQTVRSSIPFSQLIELEGVNDDCSCEAKAQVAYLEIKPRISATGEARSLTVNAKILICCECYCNNDICVVLDAYSRKYDADIIKNEVCFNKAIVNINENFNCKQNIEFSQGMLASVIDLWCESAVNRVSFENGNMIVTGTITAFIIASNSEGENSFYEKPFEFKYTYSGISSAENLKCEPQCSVLSSNYTITDSKNIELRVELAVNASVYECNRIMLITDVSVDDKKCIEKEKECAMAIYFADAGESVWDISRRYLADVNEVKQINDISVDVLSAPTTILVPIN